jgi:nitrogen fixation/metabolism regulation signal transduction histidine kinase
LRSVLLSLPRVLRVPCAVRRLLVGTAAVEAEALDTVIPITSREEIGSLTRFFNSMVGEPGARRGSAAHAEYVDPRIIAGLIIEEGKTCLISTR